MTVIRAKRKALGLTTYDMAELLNCTQSSISKAERDKGCPNLAKAELDFLERVYAVLSNEDRVLVDYLERSLLSLDDRKDYLKLACYDRVCG